ncbi:MAG: RNA polymerase sigma factor [Prolixibacteraceae bacterium]
MDEQQIIAGILAGNVDRYKLLVEKYQNPVFRVILRITGSPEDAGELTQDVFVKAYESLGQYKPGYKFFSWIYRIAINSALLFMKRKKTFLELDRIPDQLLMRSETEPDYESRDRLLNLMIGRLHEHHKSVVLLKYYANLSYAEIAATLDLPEKTVKSRLFDARKILRDRLLKTDFFPFTQYN